MRSRTTDVPRSRTGVVAILSVTRVVVTMSPRTLVPRRSLEMRVNTPASIAGVVGRVRVWRVGDAAMTLAGYTAQAPFLVNVGILDALQATGAPTTPAYLREASAVQKLLSPTEMGESFKVLALARSADIAWTGFAQGDRSHKL